MANREEDDPPLKVPEPLTDPVPQSTHFPQEKVRAFLAIGSVCLLGLLLIIYALTREVILLSTGTVFVTICVIAYRYYFPSHK